MAEKVEKFKISKEQMAFSKKFKQLRKVSLFLQNDLKGQLDGAEMLREQLREVNEELELMSTDAPPPNLNELEGQEEVRE